MCGIAGLISNQSNDTLEQIKGMIEPLSHRGPDDNGYWIDSSTNVALGHTRLSIQDLTATGKQPMISNSGRFVIVFNGEIYNFPDLRKQLENHYSFKSGNDTEVILAASEVWGIEQSVEKFCGMFAFALYDTISKDIWFFRDRIGKKPLYYGWQNKIFFFASELKAIKQLKGLDLKVNEAALALYVKNCYIPSPHSIYANVFKLQSGCFLKFNAKESNEVSDSFSPYPDSVHRNRPKRYWSAYDAFVEGETNRFGGSEQDALTTFSSTMNEVVRERLVSDVTVGALLSGGLDSSTVVALMQKHSHKNVKTFSIGFHEEGFNEAEFATAVAKQLGTDHTNLYLTAQDAVDLIPKLPGIYDEPFADSSQIPTYFVCGLAKSADVKVLLSGDGGDELLSGYTRYQSASDDWDKIAAIPWIIRKSFSSISNSALKRAFFNCFKHGKMKRPSNRIDRISQMLAKEDLDFVYDDAISYWKDPSAILREAYCKRASEYDSLKTDRVHSAYRRMLLNDYLHYLPDDILVKVDRASMAHSVEVRAPLCDHRPLEFVTSLPDDILVRKNSSKWMLREILSEFMPLKLVDRDKMGFGIPVGKWFKGPLRDWAEYLLSKETLIRTGAFKVEVVRTIWQEHVSGVRDWQYHLWITLMFQAWHVENV